MALSKVNFNSMNVTPSASKAIKFNSSNNGLETGDIGGSLVLISTQTASNSSAISFTSGIDSTYKEYQFHFIDVHPVDNSVQFLVNFRDGGTDYDATKTTTYFNTYHDEADSGTGVGYNTGQDLAQSTGDQTLGDNLGDDADASLSGYMYLFNPSSTTFIKHFIAQTTFMEQDSTPYSMNSFTGGYCNVTAAIDGVTFKMNSGNIDSGVIKMYGITK